MWQWGAAVGAAKTCGFKGVAGCTHSETIDHHTNDEQPRPPTTPTTNNPDHQQPRPPRTPATNNPDHQQPRPPTTPTPDNPDHIQRSCSSGVWQWGVAVGCGSGVRWWGAAVGCGSGVRQWGVAMGCGIGCGKDMWQKGCGWLYSTTTPECRSRPNFSRGTHRYKVPSLCKRPTCNSSATKLCLRLIA